jgi:hypothetical protein
LTDFTLEDTALRLESIPFRLRQYLKQNIARIAEQTIGQSIKQQAALYGLSDKVMKHLVLVQDELNISYQMKYRGPVRGTAPRHKWFVAPVEKKALSWSSNGTQYFSRGHFVSGVDAKYVLNEGVQRGIIPYKVAIKAELEAFQEATKLR